MSGTLKWPDKINYKLENEELSLPGMFRCTQLIERERVADIADTVRQEVEKLSLPSLEGKRIAVTAGSRGIANIAEITKALVAVLKSKGANPFIVPAMGSHAGATADGQTAFLENYGVTAESMGVPVISSMDAVQIGTSLGGVPVFCDKNALNADGIVLCNRVKAHTDFKADLESGLCKMMLIGLGKHKGATAMHQRGIENFRHMIPDAAQTFLSKAPVLFGLATVENAFEETSRLEAIPADQIIAREKILLASSKKTMARIPVDNIDILVIDEIGKDKSGAGMDPNVTGRPMNATRDFEGLISVKNIVVLGLTRVTHGNALGLGMADYTTLDVAREIDLGVTYTNGITALDMLGARIPLVANTAREAVQFAALSCAVPDPEHLRIVHIRSTLDLAVLELSQAFKDEVEANPRLAAESECFPLAFDKSGRLPVVAVH